MDFAMGQINATIQPGHEWLEGAAANTYSQFGEDGLVRAIFDRIGITNRWCFEVGAMDGRYLSNSLQWREAGWDAILIEANEQHFAKLAEYKSDKVRVVHEKIEPESLDRILAEQGAPTDLDFGCIDIDGQDYYCWAGMEKFAPRVMLVETSVQDSPIPPLGGPGQAGFHHMRTLAMSKGYIVVAKTHCNIVCVKQELLT
jgi:hypothetical protein